MDDFATAIGLSFGFFGAFKLLSEGLSHRFRRRREEYEFSKIYVEAIADEKAHPICIEKGFYVLSGRICSLPEIKHLLSLPNPSQVIEDTRMISQFIEFSENSRKYQWKEGYRNRLVRVLKNILWLSGFVFYACLAVMSIMGDGYFPSVFGQAGGFIIFSMGAGWCYSNSADYRDAWKFMAKEKASQVDSLTQDCE